jgi:hypothetical protein
MTKLTAIFLLIGISGFLAGWFVYNRKRLWRTITATFIWVIASLLLFSGGYSYWYYHRPLPEPVNNKILFEGITYTREVHQSPRPIIVHIVTIDLNAPGISFLVTPSALMRDREFSAKTTSQFLQEFDVQLAINAGFFEPFYAKGPFWYYPHVGDPVNVYGVSISQGTEYSQEEPGYNALYISHDNHISIGQPLESSYNAVAGYSIFLKAGKLENTFDGRYYQTTPGPRTAVALDKSGRIFMLFVVDGRQPNYSEGISLPELAQIILRYGGYTALNLDGGGSTTLVKAGLNGKPIVLNSPVHGRVPPGRERPVANHLGIFAARK